MTVYQTTIYYAAQELALRKRVTTRVIEELLCPVCDRVLSGAGLTVSRDNQITMEFICQRCGAYLDIQDAPVGSKDTSVIHEDVTVTLQYAELPQPLDRGDTT